MAINYLIKYTNYNMVSELPHCLVPPLSVIARLIGAGVRPRLMSSACLVYHRLVLCCRRWLSNYYCQPVPVHARIRLKFSSTSVPNSSDLHALRFAFQTHVTNLFLSSFHLYLRRSTHVALHLLDSSRPCLICANRTVGHEVATSNHSRSGPPPFADPLPDALQCHPDLILPSLFSSVIDRSSSIQLVWSN
ncbi:unnamed protein product [Citrullus colocynthis]|uniref:Uncharacterized protein n=1 Tax=Citrullus colocynthis TaxID=252529 RepID=A0ABP0Z705_9ROSI